MKTKTAKLRNQSRSVQLQDVSTEVRAYIHQQLTEFEPFFLPDSNVGVMVRRELNERQETMFSVHLVLTGGGTFVESVGRGEDVFTATTRAKEDLLAHLYEVQSQILEGEGDAGSISDGSPTWLH